MPIYQQRNSRGRLNWSYKFDYKRACLGYKFGYPPNEPAHGGCNTGADGFGHQTVLQPPGPGTPGTPCTLGSLPRSEMFSQVRSGSGTLATRGTLTVGSGVPRQAATRPQGAGMRSAAGPVMLQPARHLIRGEPKVP